MLSKVIHRLEVDLLKKIKLQDSIIKWASCSYRTEQLLLRTLVAKKKKKNLYFE